MQQREFYRLNITAFCSLRLRKLGAKQLPFGDEFEVEIQNISGGGLCFLTDRDLPISEVLVWQFQIDIPNHEINVYGQLVWKQAETEEMFLYGVKFLFFKEDEQRNLISKINTLQIRRKQAEKYAAW
ncbi:PilZ domain-containing protein [Effusibacillus consociatus]|uniref:PilZ domain-containing protein n=1 Tax=Effusibacillus consociatus TaxID=1117041 RepID=A0ABV9Q641_9BACL